MVFKKSLIQGFELPKPSKEDIKKKIRSNCNFTISIQVMALNIYEVIKW